MDGHVQVRVNLQAAAVHNLYSAKALGCIVNGHHGHAHDFLQDLNGVEWNGMEREINGYLSERRSRD